MTSSVSEPDDDRRWFDSLYHVNHAAVLAYARRRVPDADDVVSEVFAAAWRHRGRVPDPPLPWLLRTASNHVLHSQRSTYRRDRLSARASGLARATPDHADSVAERQDAATVITPALAALSAFDQEVLRLSAWEELDTAHLAYVLGCSPTAARVRLHRARTRLARELNALERREAAHPNHVTVEVQS